MIIVKAARLDRRGVETADGAADSGDTDPLGDDFVILDTYLNGLSTGLLSPYGITVSVARLLAWSIPLRAFAGSPSRARSGRPLRRRPLQPITADQPPADVLHCVSMRAVTMPVHSQCVITRGNVSAIVPAVPI